jgi:hypothetical protein
MSGAAPDRPPVSGDVVSLAPGYPALQELRGQGVVSAIGGHEAGRYAG